MGLHRGMMLRAALLATILGSTAAGFISNGALLEHRHDSTGRSLLQAKKRCSVSFEDANYTVVTSNCKNLLYQQSQCCCVLREFACPYSTCINDPSTDCAATMFSYISIYGKYPPGLFSSTCHDGDNGLKCSGDVPEIKPGQEASFGTAGVTAPAAAAAFAAGVAALLLLMSL